MLFDDDDVEVHDEQSNLTEGEICIEYRRKKRKKLLQMFRMSLC